MPFGEKELKPTVNSSRNGTQLQIIVLPQKFVNLLIIKVLFIHS